MKEYLPVIGILLGIIAVLGLAVLLPGLKHPAKMKGTINRSSDPVKTAGKKAEQYASDVIKSALKDDDILLKNVEFTYEGRPAELDDVVINQYGVFIIEVKYYTGTLSGKEDDHEWKKTNRTDSGKVYVKNVKNPIGQVKRQIYLIANHLKSHGINVWVKGYVLLLDNNSPVKSEYVLTSISEMKKVLHEPDRKTLDKKEIKDIKSLLSKH